MAISSYQTYLMEATYDSATPPQITGYTKLCDIRTKPSFFDAPEVLDTTTMSDPSFTNILGIQQTGAKEFQINYDYTEYTNLKAKEGTEMDLAIYFGTTGTNGIITFKGYIHLSIDETNVNEVQTATITIATTSDLSFS